MKQAAHSWVHWLMSSPRAIPSLALLLCLAGTARAADPSPEALLSRARDAQGGAAWDGLAALRLEGKLLSGGLEGKVDSLTDVRTGRYRDAFELGPVKGVNGFDGALPWSQDSSGVPRAEAAEPPRRGAVTEAYRRRQGWWAKDLGGAEVKPLGERREGEAAFQVLSITPRGGRTFELWLRPDGLFDRTVEDVDGRPITTTFGDWREVAGVKVAFRQRTSRGDGVPEHDVVIVVERAEPDPPTPDAAFALPPPPAPDFGFAAGRTATTVPFEILNGHIYLDVRLDGKGPFRLLVDTGGVNILTPPTAKALGLVAEGKLPGAGVGEKTEDIAMTRVERVEVGDAFVEHQTFFIYPLDAMAPVEGVPEHGIIGYELFRRFAAKVDYDHSALTLYAPDAFRYEGPGTVVPFTFNQHVPQVDGAVDGLPGKFDVDTGSRSSLDLLAPFVEAHGLAKRYGARTARIDGWGIGGPSRGHVVRAGKLTLGGAQVDGVVTGLSVQKQGAFASTEVAGNVGYGVLSRFTLYLDYPRQRLILEPGERYRARDTYDKAGLWIHLAGEGFEVIEVVPGTPAAAAGLAVGDHILAVDGRRAAALGLPLFRKLLRVAPAGRVLKLEVERGGAVRKVSLTLRDLV